MCSCTDAAVIGAAFACVCLLLLLGEAEDIGGEGPYDPQQDEAVVLLSAKVDGAPAVGADIVRFQRQPDNSWRMFNPALEGMDLAS